MQSLNLFIDASRLPLFFLLLQQGVGIRRRVGCSVEAFLRQEMGVARETIETIQSIMLDGRPVDDIASSLVHDGSTLALSAAMPGLVGATLRRGGAYGSFRSGITYQETNTACAQAEGRVRVKIFNLLMAELGIPLFRAGFFVGGDALGNLLQERSEELGQGWRVLLDDRQVETRMLGTAIANAGEVFLKITAERAKE